MPPRVSSAISTCGSFNVTSLLQALPRHPDNFTKCKSCLFSTSSNLEMKRKGRTKKKQLVQKDPYRLMQVRQRKTANLEKRRQLTLERAAALGDPVRSKPTPFLASLNLQTNNPSAGTSTGSTFLNYQLTPSIVKTQLKESKWLTEPLQNRPDGSGVPIPEQIHARRLAEHDKLHKNAQQAISKITNLANSSNKDRTRINIQRCIQTFGRHTTDATLPPKPASLGSTKAAPTLSELASNTGPTEEEIERQRLRAELAAIPKRAGPDTGSSEVQVAILTTKINVLADNLLKGDKHNKRSLRLLVHKRQKLLKYLRRKERGGPRWQNLVESLGINDAMWKGEISLA